MLHRGMEYPSLRYMDTAVCAVYINIYFYKAGQDGQLSYISSAIFDTKLQYTTIYISN